jgi:hypothetical protein
MRPGIGTVSTCLNPFLPCSLPFTGINIPINQRLGRPDPQDGLLPTHDLHPVFRLGSFCVPVSVQVCCLCAKHKRVF